MLVPLLEDARAAIARGDRHLAIAIYTRLLAQNADLEAYFNRAVLLHQMQRHKEAIADYSQALRLDPSNAEILLNRGACFESEGQVAEALADYAQVQRLAPHEIGGHLAHGAAVGRLGRLADAVSDFETATRVAPNNAAAHYNLGTALQALGKNESALNSFDKAASLAPQQSEIWNNRGLSLMALDRPADAVTSFDQALARRRDIPTLINRSVALRDQNRFDEALSTLDAVLAVEPNNADAQLARAVCLLTLGRFEEAWPNFEARWAAKDRATLPSLTGRRWDGVADIRGRRFLMHAEQGLGDTIQFSRYALVLSDRGAHVLLRVQQPLKALLTGSLKGRATVLGYDDPIPHCDLHAPLMSLPAALDPRLAAVPTPPYLHSTAIGGYVISLGERRLSVGLSWRGSAGHPNDRRRSIVFSQALDLLHEDVHWVVLQQDISLEEVRALRARPNVTVLDAFKDFADTAAIVKQLDLVISVDTSIAHLAGAMARPVWILLPYSPDWRWGVIDAQSRWYPSARLFRQRSIGDWSEVLRQVREALRSMVKA